MILVKLHHTQNKHPYLCVFCKWTSDAIFGQDKNLSSISISGQICNPPTHETFSTIIASTIYSGQFQDFEQIEQQNVNSERSHTRGTKP